MKTTLLLPILLIICGCDGVIANHYAVRGNEPLDGTFGNSRFDSNDVSYTQCNLEYLNDRKTRNNNLDFASAKKYLEMNHQIAYEYVDNYQKFLKVDAKELEHGLKVDQYGVKGSDILRKMEAGHLVARPMQGNIEIIQALKDEKNKIAFPDYMAEYLNAYDDGISSVDAGKNIDDKEDVALKHENDQRMKNRDDYVEYYNINDDATARYKKYQEIFLE